MPAGVEGRRERNNIHIPPMANGMQNRALFFHSLKKCIAVVQVKRIMKIIAAARDGTYFHR